PPHGWRRGLRICRPSGAMPVDGIPVGERQPRTLPTQFLLPISWIAWPAPLHYEIVKHPSRRVRVMANAPRGAVLRHLRALFGGSSAAEASDARLVEQFTEHHEESAFAELLRRHGPMVFGVCRRVLHNEHDAEDAFQATFLLLARRAGGIRKPAS